MTRDDESHSAGSAVPQSPSVSAPIAILSYHGNSPEFIPLGATFERDGETLLITLPPVPVARRLFFSSLKFSLFLVPTLALIWDFVTELLRKKSLKSIGGMICPSILFALVAWGMISALRRLIYIARYGRKTSTIRLWPGGIHVTAHGASRPVVFSVSRDMVAHVQIRYARQWPMDAIWLEISTKAGALHFAKLRWPISMSTGKLQDALREMLKLSTDQFLPI